MLGYQGWRAGRWEVKEGTLAFRRRADCVCLRPRDPPVSLNSGKCYLFQELLDLAPLLVTMFSGSVASPSPRRSPDHGSIMERPVEVALLG